MTATSNTNDAHVISKFKEEIKAKKKAESLKNAETKKAVTVFRRHFSNVDDGIEKYHQLGGKNVDVFKACWLHADEALDQKKAAAMNEVVQE